MCVKAGDTVGKTEKLIARLKSRPQDFTFEELQTLLIALGFEKTNKGKTSGSRVKFMKGNIPIFIHKPHPRKELLDYQVKEVLETLKKEGLI